MENLYKGMGTPYLAIFDSAETPIIDSLHNLPIGVFVTYFKYNYVEDGIDTGEIVIETNNTNVSDHPSLQYLMPLKLQWGWIYPDGSSLSGPMRSIVVKDHKLSFTPKGVKFTIELSDSSFLTKSEPADYTGPHGDLKNQCEFLGYVDNLLKGTGQDIEVVSFNTNMTDLEKRKVVKQLTR